MLHYKIYLGKHGENKMELFTLKDDDCIYDAIIKEHLNERKIILNEDIDDNVIENVCLMIMKWNKEDKDIPISLNYS